MAPSASRRPAAKKITFTFSWLRLLICVFLLAGVVGAYFGCAYFLGWHQKTTPTNEPSLVLHTLDVGSGDCLVVEFPDNKVMLVDTGKPNRYATVKTYLRELSVTTIDWFITTHADDDHAGSVTKVLEDFTVHHVFASPCPANYDDDVYRDLRASNRLEKPTAGQVISNSTEYTVTFICPDADDADRLPSSTPAIAKNSASLMLTIEYYNKVFVLTGDATKATEELFMSSFVANQIFRNTAGKQVILKVAHHGSNTNGSSSAEFLSFVFSPNNQDNYALISCGDYKTYHHPASQTVERLREHCPEDHIYVTNQMGTIMVQANQRSLTINGVTQTVSYWWIFAAVGGTLAVLCFVNYSGKMRR